MYTIDRQEMKVTDSRSDSCDLPSVEIPEVVKKTTLEMSPTPSMSIPSGYTVDDCGLLNNYAILTPMYLEEPTLPTAEERFRSKSRIIFAILITAVAMFIALAVS